MELFGFDLRSFILIAGYLGILGIVFAESGLFIGFFLPGDSLLFTAGFLASQGFFNIWILMSLCFIGAVLGDSFGYAFGKKTGPKLFKKENSLVFSKENLGRAKNFYERHGGKAIILARFIPVVRTFAPILAGVGEMRYATFLFFNIAGAFLWAIGLTFLGYFLGNIIPNIDRYLFPLVALIIILSFLPPIFSIIKNKEERDRFVTAVKKLFGGL